MGKIFDTVTNLVGDGVTAAKDLLAKAEDEAKSSPARTKEAADNLRNTQINHINLGSEDAKKQAIADADNIASAVKKATGEELDKYKSLVDEDFKNADITSKEGLKTTKDYADILYSVLADSKAYEQLTGDYKKAQFLSAISGGLSQAFGVPAIDFTKKPSIQVAKEALDETRKYINDLRATTNKRKQEQIDTEKEIGNRNIDAQEKAALAKAQISQNTYNTLRSAEALTNANLDNQKAQEQYLLDKGPGVNQAIGEQSYFRDNTKPLTARFWDIAEGRASK